MNLSEPYPTPTPSPLSGIPDQITGYLSGLVPAGLVDTGIAVVFAVPAVILAALGYHHTRRGTWLSGWLSGPSALIFALIAASYGVRGLPNLLGKGGFDPAYPDMQSLLVSIVVALLAAILVGGASWPVAVHVTAYRGSQLTLVDLKGWVLQGDRLHAAGGAGAGAAVAWIGFDPLLCAAGTVIGLLVTVVVMTWRATPAVRSAPTRPPVAQPEPRSPAHPTISDEW